MEKPKGDGGKINGGFFVMKPSIFDYIEGDETIWEQQPVGKLADEGELMAFEHEGFWQPMDTMRERDLLQDMWASGSAPWRIW